MSKTASDNLQVAEALLAFESQALVYATRFIPDAKVRSEYVERVKEVSRSTRELYDARKITALQAEEIAHSMRNQIMDFARMRTSEMGRSAAIILKERGIPLDELVTKYSQELFGKAPDRLSAAERNTVALKIVEKAGETNVKVNRTMRGLGRAGRGLWVLTALVAAYNIGSAENKWVAAGREGANIAGGLGGGAAGGALVGAALTGPAAPIGSTIGAIMGGILGAIVADEAYVGGVVPLDESVPKILPQFTQMFSRDERGLANALYDECGINIDQVCVIVEQLNQYYTSDADDVIYEYVQLVRKHRGMVETALKLHPKGRQVLIATLDSGWTTQGEYKAIDYLMSLGE